MLLFWEILRDLLAGMMALLILFFLFLVIEHRWSAVRFKRKIRQQKPPLKFRRHKRKR